MSLGPSAVTSDNTRRRQPRLFVFGHEFRCVRIQIPIVTISPCGAVAAGRGGQTSIIFLFLFTARRRVVDVACTPPAAGDPGKVVVGTPDSLRVFVATHPVLSTGASLRRLPGTFFGRQVAAPQTGRATQGSKLRGVEYPRRPVTFVPPIERRFYTCIPHIGVLQLAARLCLDDAGRRTCNVARFARPPQNPLHAVAFVSVQRVEGPPPQVRVGV